jgi:hypothetical protein
MMHSVPNVSHSRHGAGRPVHFALRFLHASQATEIRAWDCRFLAAEGWPSCDCLIGRALDDKGILDHPSCVFWYGQDEIAVGNK